MLPQWVKDGYMATVGRLTYGNSLLHRAYWLGFPFRPRGIGGFRVLHLGCGPNYIEGFYNVDANLMRRRDLLLDFTRGLPFPDDSFDLC